MNALLLSLERLRVDLERQIKYRSLRLIAVSYTHLDVYKRQEVETAPWANHNKEGVWLARTMLCHQVLKQLFPPSIVVKANDFLWCYMSVSYTHLDVYKRQVYTYYAFYILADMYILLLCIIEFNIIISIL